MTQPRILLFDFGGVLVDLDKERCISAFEHLGFNLRPLIGTYAQNGILASLERGEATVDEFCQAVRQASNLPLANNDIVEAWKKFLVDVPPSRLEMLLKLKKHYRMALLSNTNVIHWNMGLEFFAYKGLSVDNFFDHKFLSYEMHLEKPQPEIFESVVKSMQCQPEEILFFDDSEANCRAARHCGLKALLAPAGGEWLNYFDTEGRLNDFARSKI